MPALTNHRREQFALLIFQGVAPINAYPMAGYRHHNGNPFRLRADERLQARLAELEGLKMAERRVTLDSVTQQLDEDRVFAQSVGQAGPALAATMAQAKLHGLIIDRQEVGKAGDFAALTSADQVLDLVRRELGEATAAALAAALSAPAMIDVTPQPARATVDASDGDATD